MVFFLAEGLGKESETVQPGYDFHFPADHGSHEASRLEWWYFTGHLAGSGEKAGFELTFFRTKTGVKRDKKKRSAWEADTLFMANFAITDELRKKFRATERIDRATLGRAGADIGRLHAWVGRWEAREDQKTIFLTAEEGEGSEKAAIRLFLTPVKPPVIHGKRGTSPKDAQGKNFSRYYSYSRLTTTGELTLGGKTVRVTGVSWMDHEFGSGFLAPEQEGWDWFSIQVNDSTEWMIYRIRNRDNSPPFSFGTAILPDGTSRGLSEKDFSIRSYGKWTSPSGVVYPTGWEIVIRESGEKLRLEPSVAGQELSVMGGNLKYWEGSVSVTGSSPAKSGVGYVELTGYDSQLGNLLK